MISFNVGASYACFWSPELTVCGAIYGRTQLCEASTLLRSGSGLSVAFFIGKQISVRFRSHGADRNSRRACRLCSLLRPNAELRQCADRNLVSSSCFRVSGLFLGSGLFRYCTGPLQISAIHFGKVHMLLKYGAQGFGELEQGTSSQAAFSMSR